MVFSFPAPIIIKPFFLTEIDSSLYVPASTKILSLSAATAMALVKVK